MIASSDSTVASIYFINKKNEMFTFICYNAVKQK